MKVLLFGATGNLGGAIANELKEKGYEVTVVVRKSADIAVLKSLSIEIIWANVLNPPELKSICSNFDIVISALGKSVSPSNKSKHSFMDVDLHANSNILNEAVSAKVKKFIYVSAFHAEKYLFLDYFKAHHEFSQKLISSGLNYSIIKPPAIFSAFDEMIQMAQKGRLMNIGVGDKKTNPIYQGDLAKIIVNSINSNNTILEAGGKSIYTRKQINEIVQLTINPSKSLRTIPLSMFKFFLPVLKIMDKNMYDKFAFFTEVYQHDTIAPQIGEKNFQEYMSEKKLHFRS